ncbi:MAG: serine/threonine protein kinase [Myxococcales bacterium FL481]|nr:MAG: serine/threonine protein kinase [Myxococcales bacterium FL481]
MRRRSSARHDAPTIRPSRRLVAPRQSGGKAYSRVSAGNAPGEPRLRTGGVRPATPACRARGRPVRVPGRSGSSRDGAERHRHFAATARATNAQLSMTAQRKLNVDALSETDGPTRVDDRRGTVAESSELTTAGVYDIVSQLGAGGGGTVYRGVDRTNGREVAVKVLRRDLVFDSKLVTRFAREVRAVNLIKHPHIVEVFEFGELPDGRPYYGMELLAGTDLRSLIDQRGRISTDHIVPILAPVCAAVSAAHDAGVIHRDLKARNIMVDEQPDGLHVKLLDFGIAKLVEPDPDERGLTRAGTLLGTPVAMAPEQVRGEAIDHRADIYALGILLYQMLTGAFPYYSDHEPELFRMHLEDPPPRPSAAAPVSAAYDAIVARALAKSPDDRYQRATDLLAALRSAAHAPDPTPAPVAGCDALGVCVQMSFVDPDACDDEDALDDIMNAQDIADEILRDNGFEVALTTSSTVLGVRALGSATDSAHACQLARDVGETIRQELDQRDDPDDRVLVRVAVHFGRATLNPGASATVSGGEILDLAAWLPIDLDEPVTLTDAVTTRL